MQENNWKIIFQGKLIAIENLEGKGYERAVRPPGVRLVLSNDDGEILLTKEYRSEIQGFDYRLPGGKVFDDIDSFLKVRGDSDMIHEHVLKAGRIEAKEEAGVDEINNLELFYTSHAGATIDWTLYYLKGHIISMSEQKLHGDELINGIEVGFYSFSEITSKIQNGEMHEDRSIAVLCSQILK